MDGDPLTANLYLYANGNPVGFNDPSGHDGLADLLTTLGLDESVDAESDSSDVQAQRSADNVIEKVENDEFAALGEELWIDRLEGIGFKVIPLQQFSSGTHGIDLIAFGTPASTGVFTILVGEVKATTGTGLTSLLGSLEDGALQLSLKWIQTYQHQLFDALFNYITSQVVALPSLSGNLRKAIQSGIANAGFDYYLLRARLFPAGYWDTEGFQLIQVGSKGVKVGATGNIEEIEEPETIYL